MEALFPGSSRARRRFELGFVELPEGEATGIRTLTVTPYGVVHPSGAPAYALRIECKGKVISYSGDTEWTDSLLSAARDADLFVCEAYFFEKKVPYHLDYRTLMEHRSELRVPQAYLYAHERGHAPSARRHRGRMGRGRQVADAVIRRQCRGASIGHALLSRVPSTG